MYEFNRISFKPLAQIHLIYVHIRQQQQFSVVLQVTVISIDIILQFVSSVIFIKLITDCLDRPGLLDY